MAVTPTSRPDARGFTLLELLLAIVILSLVTATVYGSLSRTESSKRIAESRSELYSAGRLAVMKLAGDIEAALPPPSGDRIYFRGGGGRSSAPELHLVTMNRGGFGMNRVRPGRVLVVYSLLPIAKRRGQYSLLREEYLYKAMLDKADGIQQQPSSSLDEQDEDQAPTEQASLLLECPNVQDDLDLPGSCLPVTSLIFRYFDDTVGDWRDDWDSTVDNSATYGRLPAAVEITLTLADEDGAEHPFYTVVDLPLARGQPTPAVSANQRATGQNGDHDADEHDESDHGTE
ncbi:prepilin-type N-terminal cleavage/methylation domain-containing protein [bacterium]|nr:prepilin-type N-terminal cleavage/methylation domain-containing protein [bacterium]